MLIDTTELHFNRNGLHIRIKNVAGLVCNKCGHKTIDGKLALYIDRIVQAIFSDVQPMQVREVIVEAA
jgi:YgiT-type zinc finger domain-containing protein